MCRDGPFQGLSWRTRALETKVNCEHTHNIASLYIYIYNIASDDLGSVHKKGNILHG